MKRIATQVIFLLLLLSVVIILDKLNTNTYDYALNYIQKKISHCENNIDEISKSSNDVIEINETHQVINALSDWGIYDVKEIFHKQFITNNTGWYWIIQKHQKYYVLKFKYLYPVNNQYLNEHYANCLDIPENFKLNYSEKSQKIETHSGFLPLELSEYPKYKSALWCNINALLVTAWFVLLYYVLITFSKKTRWQFFSLLIAFGIRWLIYQMQLLNLLNESFLYDVHAYAFSNLFAVKSFADVIITALSFIIYFYYSSKIQTKWIVWINITMSAILLYACIYLFTHHASFTLIISDVLFYNYQNWLYTVLSLLIILSLIFNLSYMLGKVFFVSQTIYRFSILNILLLAFTTFLIYWFQKQSLQKKVEYVFNWVENEEQVSVFEQCQIIEKKLSQLKNLNDSLYFQKISEIENATIYLQLSKRYLFEDSVSWLKFLSDKKNILPNIHINAHPYSERNILNNNSENIYYTNLIEGKYLVSVFEYISPFSNQNYYSFLSDKLFQLPSGFKNFSLALYENEYLKFKLGHIPFLEKLNQLKSLQNLYPDIIFYEKITDNQRIIVAHPEYTFSECISLFSSYFIFMLSVYLCVMYLYNVLKTKYLFPHNLSFSYKISMLVIFISVISFYLLFAFSYRHVNKTLNEEIKNKLIKEAQSINIFDKNMLVYKTDGRLDNSCFSNPLIKFKLLPAQLPQNVLQHILRNNIHFDKRRVGKYEYSVLFTLQQNAGNTYITEWPFFEEAFYKETQLNALLNPLFNIYTLLFLISFFIGVLLSNYVVHPIRKITSELNKNASPLELKKISYPYNDELGELVKNYNTLTDRLHNALIQLKKEQQEKAWKLMAQQVAHDIKNSLTPLLLNIEFLKKQISNPSQQKLLDAICSQIQMLSKTAQDFSDFAQDVQVNLSPVNLNEFLQKIITQYSHHPDIEIYFSASCNECMVNTDEHLLSRVLHNLITNSIEAVGEKGKIEIALQRNDSEIILSVKDNGCGIPAEIQSKIFEPKFSTKSSGKGLGLSIVKNICDKLNILVTFESIENKGTVFYLKWK